MSRLPNVMALRYMGYSHGAVLRSWRGCFGRVVRMVYVGAVWRRGRRDLGALEELGGDALDAQELGERGLDGVGRHLGAVKCGLCFA